MFSISSKIWWVLKRLWTFIENSVLQLKVTQGRMPVNFDAQTRPKCRMMMTSSLWFQNDRRSQTKTHRYLTKVTLGNSRCFQKSTFSRAHLSASAGINFNNILIIVLQNATKKPELQTTFNLREYYLGGKCIRRFIDAKFSDERRTSSILGVAY